MPDDGSALKRRNWPFVTSRDADVERALELHVTLRFVGATAGLATRTAHREAADRHQLQLLSALLRIAAGVAAMRVCSAVSKVVSITCGTPGRGVTLVLKSTKPGLRISISCVVATRRNV